MRHARLLPNMHNKWRKVNNSRLTIFMSSWKNYYYRIPFQDPLETDMCNRRYIRDHHARSETDMLQIRDRHAWSETDMPHPRSIGDRHSWLETYKKCLYTIRHVGLRSGMLVSNQTCWFSSTLIFVKVNFINLCILKKILYTIIFYHLN